MLAVSVLVTVTGFLIAVRVANAWVGLCVLLDTDWSCDSGIRRDPLLEMGCSQRLCRLPDSSPRTDESQDQK